MKTQTRAQILKMIEKSGKIRPFEFLLRVHRVLGGEAFGRGRRGFGHLFMSLLAECICEATT